MCSSAFGESGIELTMVFPWADNPSKSRAERPTRNLRPPKGPPLHSDRNPHYTQNYTKSLSHFVRRRNGGVLHWEY